MYNLFFMVAERLDIAFSPGQISKNGEVYFETEKHKVPVVERLIPDAPKIFLLPGWGGVTDAENPALDAYNNLGYSVIQVGTPASKEKKIFNDVIQRMPPQRGRPIGTDAHVFTALINAKTKVDENISIVGCSYGGLSAIEVANRIPEKIDHLMLINPAIRHNIDSVVALSGRYVGNMAKTTYDAVRAKGKDGFIGFVRTAGETASSPMDSIHRGFAVIHAEGTITKAYNAAKDGVKITIVTGNGDGIFHGDKTESQFRDGFISEYKREIDDMSLVYSVPLERLMPRFVRVDGGHDIGKTGDEFAHFTIMEWQATEEHFAKLA
jgi:pimeloyl-ACP methyl ester carboxylesterase